MHLTVFSQSTVLIKGDTNHCFTPGQTRFILKELNKTKYLREENGFLKTVISLKDSILLNDSLIICNQNKMLMNKEDELASVSRVYLLKEEALKKGFKSERRKKIVAYCITIIIVAVETKRLLLR